MKTILMKDIAKATGFSINTVSRALRGDKKLSKQTTDIIQTCADEMGYISNSVAASLRLKHSKIIGVITSDSSNPFFAEVIRGIEKTAKLYDYSILLVNTAEKPSEEYENLKLFCSRHVDGLLIVPVFDDERIKRLYARIDIPFLFLGRRVKGLEGHSILHEDYKSESHVVNFLIKKGHIRILYLSGPKNISSSIERFEGYRDTLINNNIKFDESLVIRTNGHIEDGYAATNRAIIKGTSFTAICCYNDLVCVGALKSLRENNLKVPEDIDIFGFDNLQISQFIYPSLSTVDVPKYALGCESTHLLMEHIENPNLRYTNKHLKTRLIFRESTKQ